MVVAVVVVMVAVAVLVVVALLHVVLVDDLGLLVVLPVLPAAREGKKNTFSVTG